MKVFALNTSSLAIKLIGLTLVSHNVPFFAHTRIPLLVLGVILFVIGEMGRNKYFLIKEHQDPTDFANWDD